MSKFSLAIVQTHATQFDGPLFRSMTGSQDISLTVYYTKPDALQPSYDPELQRNSGWNNDISSGYKHKVFPNSVWGRFLITKQLVTTGHDLVIVSGYSSITTLIIAILCKLCAIPVGLRADSVFLYREKETWKWRLKDKVLPLLFKLYTTGHPAGSLARTYMNQYGFADDALFIFPYAVDHDYLRALYEQVYPQRMALRSDMGIAPDAFVILGIIKFVPREDPITLLRAYDLVVHQHPQAHLVLVGDGELRNQIEQYIRDANLSRVHLPGYIPYTLLPTYFAISDVFVHPAMREPWGVTVNEAMVCGLPVVASDKVGASTDLIDEGKTGWIFKAGNPQSLASILNQLIARPNLCRSLAINVVNKVGDWTYEATYQGLAQALKYVSARR